ncbi:hypothetical protein VPH35_097348 [Triticum aestivum]
MVLRTVGRATGNTPVSERAAVQRVVWCSAPAKELQRNTPVLLWSVVRPPMLYWIIAGGLSCCDEASSGRRCCIGASPAIRCRAVLQWSFAGCPSVLHWAVSRGAAMELQWCSAGCRRCCFGALPRSVLPWSSSSRSPRCDVAVTAGSRSCDAALGGVVECFVGDASVARLPEQVPRWVMHHRRLLQREELCGLMSMEDAIQRRNTMGLCC